MKTATWLSAIVLGCIFVGATGDTVVMATENETSKGCRLIINWDEMNMWTDLLCHAQHKRKLDPKGVKAVLEQIMDEHAKAKVDRIVHCLFALPWGTVPPNFQSFYRQPVTFVYDGHIPPHKGPDKTGLRQFEEAGYDLIQVLLDRSHKDGVQFLCGMRMNDRHDGATSMPFYAENPEWRMKRIQAMNYEHEGVRKAVLAIAEEFLDRYDVDGIELDWMRWCHMFNPSEAEKNAPILTDFTVEMRKLLDQAAKKRGRGRLLLGVRVPATIKECRILGYDVKAWVQQGLIDYICPSDFLFSDINIRTDEFTALTKGTRCKVYPSVHPRYRDYTLVSREKLLLNTPESYRAAAKNFYAHGADGVSVYNYQFHWQEAFTIANPEPGQGWPGALSYLTGLRDPESVARGDRLYLYYPMGLYPKSGKGRRLPTGGVRRFSITLDRKDHDPTDSLGFLMAEDLKEAHLSATLKFKVAGMPEGDELEVQLNGQTIPPDQIKRKHCADGQPAFYLYSMPLTSPPAKFGDNELRLRLKKGKDSKPVNVIAQEFEVLVRDSRGR